MFKVLLTSAIKKHGFKKMLIIVGDLAVKVTKTKKDDKAWAKIKKVLEGL